MKVEIDIMDHDDKEKVLDYMSQYDFKAPINVTMIFDDDDQDNDIIEEQYEIDCNKQKHDTLIKEEILEKTENSTEPVHYVNENVEIIQDNLKSDKKKKRKIDAISSKDKDISTSKRICGRNINDCSTDPNIDKRQNSRNSQVDGITYSFPAQNQTTDINTLPERNIENLRILSQNIILVMESYYQMQRHKSNNPDHYENKIRLDAFMHVRSWTFNNAFKLAETTILPRVTDTVFIKKFLDSVVDDARTKSFNCNHWHVAPFLTDLIEYTKKRLHFRRQYPADKTNSVLKRFLSRPPASIKFPNSSDLPDNNTNSRCIFSQGPPGREITLSLLSPNESGNQRIGSNLSNHNFTSPPNAQVLHGHNFAQINHSTNAYSNSDALAYQQSCSNQSRRPPPPPYNISASQNNFSHYRYAHQNISRTTVNSTLAPQIPIDSTRSSVSTESGYASPSYGSTGFDPADSHNAADMSSSTPSISNIYTMSPGSASVPSGPCQLCGKKTTAKCRVCQRYYYCSYICEQLDASIHATVCRSSYEIHQPVTIY